MTTHADVAQWMVQELEEKKYLYQEDVVWHMRKRFGDDFVYTNENGNLAISPRVLDEFRKLTVDDVVWERGSRLWRKRQPYDPDGRRQAE